MSDLDARLADALAVGEDATEGIPKPHTCHAKGCTVPVPPKLLFCPKHWRMTPKELQHAVWAAYRPGQEIDKQPSQEYLAVMKAAIEAVAQKENAGIVQFALFEEPAGE
jgi:hypothetical protein